MSEWASTRYMHPFAAPAGIVRSTPKEPAPGSVRRGDFASHRNSCQSPAERARGSHSVEEWKPSPSQRPSCAGLRSETQGGHRLHPLAPARNGRLGQRRDLARRWSRLYWVTTVLIALYPNGAFSTPGRSLDPAHSLQMILEAHWITDSLESALAYSFFWKLRNT